MEHKRIMRRFKLDEISAVDNPAQPDALMTIMKRDNPDNRKSAGSPGVTSKSKEGHMDPKELEKKLGETESQVADLTKQVEALTAERDEAVAKASGAEEALAKAEEVKKAAEDFVEIEGERVAKADVPAPVLKAIEAQREAIAKMEADRESEKLAKRAEVELPNLAGTAEVKGSLLKAIDGMDEGARDELTKALKAADAAVSKMFEEVGKSNDDENGPNAKLEKLAKEYAAEHKVPYESAFAEVVKTKDGAELRKAIEAERN